MKEKPVFPLLVSMALPMVISMLVNSLYNIVDSFFVAQISEDAMTALSLVYPVQNFVNAVAIGFGIGLNAVISYYLGAGDKKAAGCAATQGLALTMLHAVILTIGSLLVIERFLRMFSSSETVIDLGVRYSRIIFLFTIAIMANLYFEKVFQAVGRMKVTMTGMMIGCIVNIILDPLIIFGIGPFPRLGIEGAALATGIGQVTPAVIYWIIYNINIIIPGFLIVKALINILKQGFITRILYLKIIFSNRANFAIGARRKNISPATILNRPPRILEKMENRLMIASTSFLYIRKKTNKIFITSFKRKLFSIKAFFSIRSKKFSRGLEKII